ncbi:MAG: RpiB/LacA/LacB family sugar-phosphate isomerase [Firmicutes bacterium]|nr:RpiB/LacA/LacB family sugar-phosphate isomerase [Bacillota bacterium]
MRILFVCSGNTCRSPMAAAVAPEIGKRLGIPVEARSAGLFAIAGLPLSDEAAATLRNHQITPPDHRSLPVGEEDLLWADRIVAMTADHAAALRARFPEIATKVENLSEWAGETISDPVGRGQQAYETAFARIERGITRLLKADQQPPASASPTSGHIQETADGRLLIVSDEEGAALAEALTQAFHGLGMPVERLPAAASDPQRIALLLEDAAKQQEGELAVAVNALGFDVAMAANRSTFLRAVFATDPTVAATARRTGADLLCLGAAFSGVESGRAMVRAFLFPQSLLEGSPR